MAAELHGAAGVRDDWRQALARAAQRIWERGHGRLSQWQDALAGLPHLQPCRIDLDEACITIGTAEQIDAAGRQRLVQGLQALHPWRKGPFEWFGVRVDAEWRSDWKWARLAPHLHDLAGRRILDVGCGNGYYCLRMAGAGAGWVLGIDPTLLYVMQFRAAARYLPAGLPVTVLPLSLEDLLAVQDERVPAMQFDTVFSMGVLYHRRSPLDHLLGLRRLLRPGGELVLETLVIEGGSEEVLIPPGRYAKMRNVWFIPSPGALLGWLRRCGFQEPRVVDVTVTTVAEQRPTAWMRFESLPHFLDPRDPTRTVEGLPAPRRAIVLAAG